MLAAYQTAVYNLLQAPSSPTALIPAAQLVTYINTARGQVAGQGKCIRPDNVSLALAATTQVYPFSAVIIAGAVSLGIAGLNDVRQAWYLVGDGQKILVNRPIEWFGSYYLSQPVPETGEPRYWAQRGQGQNGSLLVYPIPDIPYQCPLDVEAVPVPLVNDNTPEAIPPLWQDAVPFYAAWLALMQLQRQSDAEAMMKRFSEMMNRARQAATPDVLPGNFEGTPDMTLGNKLGISQRNAGG